MLSDFLLFLLLLLLLLLLLFNYKLMLSILGGCLPDHIVPSQERHDPSQAGEHLLYLNELVSVQLLYLILSVLNSLDSISVLYYFFYLRLLP